MIRKEKIVIKTFGNVDSKLYNADIVPVQFIVGQKVIVIECLCSPFICSDLTNQSTHFVSKNYPHLNGLFLADTSPDGNKKIEVLLGADDYYRFISGNVIRGFLDQPVAVESVFGWVISGFFDIGNHSQVNINHTHLLRVNTETNPYYDDMFKVEQMCDENKILKCPAVIEKFEKQLKFNGQRYVTKLPFFKDPYTLPDNYLIAKSRLETNFKRLQTDPQLLQRDDDVIKQYLSYGIVEKVTASNTNYAHYLPHRAVVRDERETTKLRVVFDASAKYKGFPSLNELLDPGPCLLPHLFDILIRFRLGKIALISDTKQAFLQIQIDT